MAEVKDQPKKLSSDFRKHTHTHTHKNQVPLENLQSFFFSADVRKEEQLVQELTQTPFSREERLAFKTHCVVCLEMIPESGAPEPQRSSSHLRPLVPKFSLVRSCQKHLVPQEIRGTFSSCIQTQTTDKTANTSTLTTGLIYKSTKSPK